MVFLSGNFRRTKADVGHIADALEAKQEQHPGLEDLVNAEDWL